MIAAFYTAVDGIIIIDNRGLIQDFNPACEKLFGYDAGEVTGQNVKVLMPESYAREHDQYLRNYQESGTAKIIGIGREVTGRRKDGSTFPMELSVGEIEDATTSGHYVGIIRDITERKEAETRFMALTQHLKSVIDTAVDGIIIIDNRGLIQDFNPACEKLFGYDASEVTGLNVKVLMPESYAREHDQYLRNYQESGTAKIIGIGREVTGRRKDGSTFPMELSVGEIKDATTSGHYVGIIRDITVKHETARNQEKLIAALTRSNQELDEFAYIASHDLKEPLRGLFNNAMFLEEDYTEQLDEVGVARLARMRKLSQRMEKLIDNLLYFSRLGRQDLAIKPTDLNHVIRDILSMIETLIMEENVQINMTCELPVIVCDSVRLGEVFRNLITNSIKYNVSKHKVIDIGFHPEVHGRKDVISVSDNGIGIAEEFYSDIFTIFKRLNIEDDDVQGYGVGLTFVKKIIDRHGGEIWLESKPGLGTTFYFTLK
ncbi:PAS domain-containing sensor histidine kinase [Kiloniella laminariae]|uniref:PAS domain S-box protein n=1 Tax=Kiloniella laminariae TaxID=454162 RepID=UPI0012FC8C30